MLRPQLLALLLLPLVACTSESLTLSLEDPEERLLTAPGESVTLHAVARTKSGEPLSNLSLTWTSSAPEVASVRDGTVTAHRSGRAVITVAGRDAKSSGTVRVSIPARVEVRPGEVELYGPGSRKGLRTLVLDEQDRRVSRVEPTCRSLDEQVARVEEGDIVAVSAGRTEVRCAAGEAAAGVDVRVFRGRPSRLSLSHSRHQFRLPGESLQLTARALDRHGAMLEGVDVRWFSSNLDVVKVDERGRITAVGPGKTIVTASVLGARAGVEVVVPNGPKAR